MENGHCLTGSSHADITNLKVEYIPVLLIAVYWFLTPKYIWNFKKSICLLIFVLICMSLLIASIYWELTMCQILFFWELCLCYNPHPNFVRQILLLHPIFSWGRTGLWTQAVWLAEHMFSVILLYHLYWVNVFPCNSCR